MRFTLCYFLNVCGWLACLGSVQALAGDYRLHLTPSGYSSKSSPPSGAEDVRSFDKPLLREQTPRKNHSGLVSPSLCEPSVLVTQHATLREQIVHRTLRSDQGTRCYTALFGADAAATVKLFHQGNMARWSQRLAQGNPLEQADAIRWLRVAYFARHQHGLAHYTPDTFTANLERWFTRVENWQPENALLMSEALLLADSAQQSAFVFEHSVRTLQSSDAMLLNSEGRRRVYAAQVLIQSWQHAQLVALSSKQIEVLVNELNQFITRNWGGLDDNRSYLVNNAVALLAGFLSHHATREVVVSTLSPLLTRLRTSTGRQQHKAWARASDIASSWLQTDCASLGLCERLKDTTEVALPIQHRCASTLVIRAQEMTNEQLQASCQRLLPIEQQFHQKLKTEQLPIAGDRNQHLDVVIFDDWNEYDIYATALFQISTNNGGMYLEGNPDTENNQARFVSHEADWLRPDFVVWNLEHEYVHYLDGRFNVAGNYDDSLAWPLVWWQEGMAEYLANGAKSTRALDIQKQRQLRLVEIFFTPVTPWDGDRVYSLGYLAAFFMVEQHAEAVAKLRHLLRNKQFAEYQVELTSLGKTLESDFVRWWQALEHPRQTSITTE